MWLGWDHCGYDTIDDEPQDPENNTMSWHPPPSGRGERGERRAPQTARREGLFSLWFFSYCGRVRTANWE